MKKLLLYLFLLGMSLNTQQASSQTLNCQLNISSNGKYLQIGPIGGNSERWVMKGTHSCITHLTPASGDPTGWEGGSNMINNWNNRVAQLDGMKVAGINTVRIWEPGPLGRDNPNPSYTGTTMSQHYDEIVQYVKLCQDRGMLVVMEDWWAGYLKNGNTDAYYNSGEWYDKNKELVRRLVAAGCSNFMFGTGNEEGQMQSQFGIGWTGDWKNNTIKMIAGYRRLGYNGPVLVDVSGWDNQAGDVSSFAEIQNSDPNKNIGFQEHEYWNWNGAANGYFYLPVCRAGYNGGMACENFPMFMTEAAFTVDWNVDAMANLARNNNWGGGIYFWYNGIYTACTTNGDGINLNGDGISWRDHFWKASGIPDGFLSTGPVVSVTSVTVSPTSASVSVSGTTSLTATVNPANATDKSFSWSSSNTSIATVSSAGIVTGVAVGSANITVTTTNGAKTATCAITVISSNIAVTGVSISPASFSVNVNSTQQLTSTISPANATNKTVTWSSNNPEVATVSSTGLVTGVAVGSATITVTTQDGAKTATSSVSVNGGIGYAIPARIEAENYNSMSGIATENCSEGTLNVGWTDVGDWMNYSVSVSNAATFICDFRVAGKGGSIQLKSGSTVLTSITVPNTGGWQTWQTVSSGSFNLSAGTQTIQVYVSASGWNLNWIEFKSGGSVVSLTDVTVAPTSATVAIGATTTLTATVSPSNATNKAVSWSSNATGIATVSSSGVVTGVAAGNAIITVTTQDGSKTATSVITVTGSTGQAIPGKIEAESYNSMSGIQTEACSDAGGGQDVGYTDAGDWMDYTLNVTTSGAYTVDLRIASTVTSGQIQIKNGTTILATVNLPNTGGWQTWQTVTSPQFNLSAGSQTLRVQVSASGWNINWMQFNSVTSSSNLALNKAATASSTDGALTPGNAFDGSGSTRWSSTFSDPQWIYVNLGAVYNISRVKLSWEAAYGKSYQIQVSNDAATWTNIYTTTTGDGGIDDLTGLTGSGQYVRMYGTARGTGWGYSLYEFEVYGSTLKSALTDETITEVEQQKASLQLFVYPNPVSEGVLNIHMDGQTDDSAISIYTVDGKLVFTGSLLKGETKHINTLAQGIYLIKVSGNNITETIKVLVR